MSKYLKDHPGNPATDTPHLQAVGQIVAAFASRNDATIAEIVALTTELLPLFVERSTAPDLRATGSDEHVTAKPRTVATPALDPKKAVTQDKVFCLCCGRGFTMLKRHLKAEHDFTEEQYRAHFGLAEDYPLVAPEYSERKARYAKEIGLGKYQRDKPLDDRAAPV